MSQLILACMILFCLWHVLKPKKLAKNSLSDVLFREVGSLVALALASMTLLRGEWGVGVPFLILTAALRGWLPSGSLIGLFVKPDSKARFRSASIALTLDASRRPVDGQILRGRFARRALSSLKPGELKALWQELKSDHIGRSILETYLDRRLPGWRKNFQNNTAGGGGREASSDALSQQEAYKILGVKPGASADDIRRAHRTLMKKIHPDKGGTTQMAARANQARDILLEGH